MALGMGFVGVTVSVLPHPSVNDWPGATVCRVPQHAACTCQHRRVKLSRRRPSLIYKSPGIWFSIIIFLKIIKTGWKKALIKNYSEYTCETKTNTLVFLGKWRESCYEEIQR